jgi:hypothetical protein
MAVDIAASSCGGTMTSAASVGVPIDALRITVVWADPSAKKDVAESSRKLPLHLTAALARRVGQLGMQRDGVAFRIPVHVRWKAWNGAEGAEPPRPIDLDAAASNLILIWHDAAMATCRCEWAGYLADLVKRVAARDADQILTIRASTDLVQFPQLQPVQGIDGSYLAGDVDTAVQNPDEFNGLLLRIFSILLAKRRVAQQQDPPKSFPVFLSHAKADGETVARRFLTYQKNARPAPELGVFFDAESLHAGAAYGQQFSQNIGHGALIAIETDAYHGRPWCNWEILEAKRLGRAIVVMDVSLIGTGRTFPYIGNVPLVRVARSSGAIEIDVTEQVVQRVVAALLDEALRMNVWREHAKARLATQDADLKETEILGRPPELADITIAASSRPGIKCVVYPDPPLNEHEANLISQAFPMLKVQSLGEFDAHWTATRVKGAGEVLENKMISISISPPPPQDLAMLGRLPSDLSIAIDAMLTPLVQAGANIAYGGRIRIDPRAGPEINFTRLLAQDLAAAYRLLGSERPRPFRHYLRHGEIAICRPHDVFEHAITLGRAADIRVVAAGRVIGTLQAEQSTLAFHPADSSIKHLILDANELEALDELMPLFAREPDRQRDLTAMRQLMSCETAARIVLGGTCAPGLSGRSGVAEESCLTIKAEKPLLVVGAFGGAARDIAVALGLIERPDPGLVRPEAAFINKGQNMREPYLESLDDLARERDAYLAQLKTWGILELARSLAATESLYAQSVLVSACLRRALSKTSYC